MLSLNIVYSQDNFYYRTARRQGKLNIKILNKIYYFKLKKKTKNKIVIKFLCIKFIFLADLR